MTTKVVQRLALKEGAPGTLIASMFASYSATAKAAFHSKTLSEQWTEFLLQIGPLSTDVTAASNRISQLLLEYEKALSAIPEPYKSYPSSPALRQQLAAANSSSAYGSSLRAVTSTFQSLGLGANITSDPSTAQPKQTQLAASRSETDNQGVHLASRLREFSALQTSDAVKISRSAKVISNASNEYLRALKRESNLLLAEVKMNCMSNQMAHEIIETRCKNTRLLFDGAARECANEKDAGKLETLTHLEDHIKQGLFRLLDSFIRALEKIIAGSRVSSP